jgi:hypothetical protein
MMGGREYQVFPLSAYESPSGKIVGGYQWRLGCFGSFVETQYAWHARNLYASHLHYKKTLVGEVDQS